MNIRQPQVWFGRLEDFRPYVEQLRPLLSAEENARVARFHRPADSHYFLIGRALLRILLGRRLNMQAQQVPVEYGSSGKPRVPFSCNPDRLHFNLSHSNLHLAIVFCYTSPVGIDVECLDRPVDIEPLAKRILTEQEHVAFAELPETERQQALIRTWTQKEASLKALGTGVSGGMHKLQILPAKSGGTVAEMHAAPDDTARHWYLHEYRLEQNELCTVAMEQEVRSLQVRKLPELLRLLKLQNA